MNIILSRIMIVTCGLQAVFLASVFAAAVLFVKELQCNWKALKRMWHDGIE